MIARHTEKIQSDVHRSGNREARNMLDAMLDSTNLLRNETQFSITSTHVSKHEGIGKLNAKSVRKLVKHDGEVLQSLVDTTRMANELADSLTAMSPEEVIQMISDWQQKLNRTRNIYLERNMYIDGLTKK
jgi:transcriptional regulatory protein LevR